MKLLFALITCLLAITGCEKSSNVTAMQDEANGLANQYKGKFDDLQKRITLLENRGKTMTTVGQPSGLIEVRKLFLDTSKRLADLKTAVTQATASIAATTKSEHPRVELIRLMGEYRERFEKGETEVTANLDAVEGWLAYVDFRPRETAPPTPVVDDKKEPPDSQPQPLPDGPAKIDDKKPADKKPEAKKPADKKPEDKKPADKKPGPGSARPERKGAGSNG